MLADELPALSPEPELVLAVFELEEPSPEPVPVLVPEPLSEEVEVRDVLERAEPTSGDLFH